LLFLVEKASFSKEFRRKFHCCGEGELQYKSELNVVQVDLIYHWTYFVFVKHRLLFTVVQCDISILGSHSKRQTRTGS